MYTESLLLGSSVLNHTENNDLVKWSALKDTLYNVQLTYLLTYFL